MVSDSVQADLALATAAARGDAEAQRALVERLLNRVRATVHYLTAGQGGSDDLVQLSLVHILRGIAGYRGESQLEPWADRITVRTCLRELRRSRRCRGNELPVEGAAGADPCPADGLMPQEQGVLRQQLRCRLALMLGKLTPERQLVVVLRWVHGYTVEEIANLTDTPPNTVRGRLQVGRKQLRRLILRDDRLRDWWERNRP